MTTICTDLDCDAGRQRCREGGQEAVVLARPGEHEYAVLGTRSGGDLSQVDRQRETCGPEEQLYELIVREDREVIRG
jgi:hypothetical protein